MQDTPALPLNNSSPAAHHNSQDRLDDQMIIHDLIRKKSIVAIHAERSADATWFALGLTLGMARMGEVFGRFLCSNPQKVLYLEGAMASGELEQWAESLQEDHVQSDYTLKSFCGMQADTKECLSLFKHKLWHDIKDELTHGGYGTVVFDSTASLFLPTEDSIEVQRTRLRLWMMQLRELGFVQLFIVLHGKAGFTPDEDLVDTRLALHRNDEEENLVLQVEVDARYLPKRSQTPFTIELVEKEEGKRAFIDRKSSESDFLHILGMALKGKRQEDIAIEVGLSQPTVSRRLQDAEDRGIIKKRGRIVELTSKGRRMLMLP